MSQGNNPETTQEQQIRQFITRLLDGLFARVSDGTYDYRSDMMQLNRLLETARQQGVQSVEGNIFNAMGIVCGYSGNYVEAQQNFLRGYDAYVASGAPVQGLVELSNYAMSKRTAGDYEAAVETFKRIFDEAEALNGLPPINAFIGYVASSYFLESYADIHHIVQQLHALRERYDAENPYSFTAHMPMLHSYQARVALRTGDATALREHMVLATDFLRDRHKAGFHIAFLWMTRAYRSYLVEQDGGTDDAISQAISAMENAKAPVQGARFYFEEAIDAARFGLIEIAHNFASRALAEFERREMHTDIARVQHLMSTLPA